MCEGNWLDVLPTKSEQCSNRVKTSTKITPIQDSSKKNDGFVYKILSDKRKKRIPNFESNDLVRTADIKRKFFSKGDTTNWSYKLYKFTEIKNDTIPT